MSDEIFVHGIRVVKGDGEVRVVLTPNQSVVGIVGTADAASETLVIDRPVAFLKKSTALNAIRPKADVADQGTLYASVRSIFAQGARVVVAVRSKSNSIEDCGRAIEKLLEAESITSYKPKVLCAPGHVGIIPTPAPARTVVATNTKDKEKENSESTPATAPVVSRLSAEVLADPLASKLKEVARRLNAIVSGDAPVGREKEYREANGSERLYLVSPAAKEFMGDSLIDVPGSAHAAGILATINFWESPSNREIKEIVGTSVPVSFALDDPDSDGQRLNAIQVATIVRLNGFRLWGVRGTGDQTDLTTNQLQKVRISDAIKEALISSHAYAVARNLTRTYFDTVTASVNKYLADLQVEGAIAGGVCYPKDEANTPENLFDGKATFVYSYTPSPVSETLIFEEQITDRFLANIVK